MSFRFTLRQLEYFVAVGDAGSIAEAAQRLSISSPSISTAIAQLEDAFGIALFVRQHAQGLSLTAGGRRFYKAAQEVLESAGALHDVAGEISGAVRGPITVGCLVTLAPYILPELRKSFVDTFPDVSFRQEEAHQAALFKMIRRAELDTAITYDMEVPPDIEFEPLADFEPYAVFAPDHPLAQKRIVLMEDLVPHPFVLLDLPISREYFMSLFQAAGLKPQIAETTAHLSMVRTMVANGFGYSLLNVPSATALAPDGKPLVFRPVANASRTLRIGLITMRNDRKTSLMSAFEAHCRSWMDGMTSTGKAVDQAGK